MFYTAAANSYQHLLLKIFVTCLCMVDYHYMLTQILLHEKALDQRINLSCNHHSGWYTYWQNNIGCLSLDVPLNFHNKKLMPHSLAAAVGVFYAFYQTHHINDYDVIKQDSVNAGGRRAMWEIGRPPLKMAVLMNPYSEPLCSPT